MSPGSGTTSRPAPHIVEYNKRESKLNLFSDNLFDKIKSSNTGCMKPENPITFSLSIGIEFLIEATPVKVPLAPKYSNPSFSIAVPMLFSTVGKGAGEKARQEQLLREGYSLHEEKIFYEDGAVGIVITGQTTLRQVEKMTGISAKKIASALGLSTKVSLDENFGRLRKKHPFTLQEARDVISALLNREAAAREEKEETQVKQKIKEEEEPKEFRGRA